MVSIEEFLSREYPKRTKVRCNTCKKLVETIILRKEDEHTNIKKCGFCYYQEAIEEGWDDVEEIEVNSG